MKTKLGGPVDLFWLENTSFEFQQYFHVADLIF